MATVLLIDDEPILLTAFGDYLTDEGFTVFTAATGEEGLNLYRQMKPDAVICDLILPGIGGLDVLASIEDSDVPFIILSGNQDIRKALEAQHLGAWDYLMKPLEDLGQMTLTLFKVLERRDLLRRQKEHQTDLEQRVKARTWELKGKVDELQAAQERLKSSLAEKNILLSEVHHRVKNNLQIILSLIGLQQSRISNTEAQNALEEVSRRIHSMAAIHETLTDTGFASKIPCGTYLFNLFKDTLVSRGLDTRQITMANQDMELEIGQAFPAGLAVFEIGAALVDQLEKNTPLSAILDLKLTDGKFFIMIKTSQDLFEKWQPESRTDLHGILLEVLVKQLKGKWTRTAHCLEIVF